jgi:16S rRNA (cytidine1402-2'-O)-methyltransferase
VKGTVYLIPVTLGGDDYKKVIPEEVLNITRSLRHFIVEDLRSARRFLRLIDKAFPIDETHFYILNEHTAESELELFLQPVMNGSDAGLMSEAGLPGIADPGAKITALAHIKRIQVRPLSGPSSILLALIASGLNGQHFTFNGYLPVKPAERNARIREIEKSASKNCAQIFMETPYRNQKLLEAVLEVCNEDTKLCIAVDISLPSESVSTRSIRQWKKEIPQLAGRLVVFVMQ